jgi:ribosomal protein L2
MAARAPLLLAGSALTLLAMGCARESSTTAFLEPEAADFAKVAPPPPAGTLSLCKVAGAGVGAGTVFTFDVVLAGVARVADVAAGSCLDLLAPVERRPSSKGWYQRKLADVARLLPDGTGLVVDAALLDAAQVSVILGGGAGVQASSSLLLNLVQQLIAADLNVLRGAQPTPEVVQAIADANAGISIDPGPPITLTTSLGTAEMSTLVNTLTAFNEGKLNLPAAPATTLLGVTEQEDALSELLSIVCAPSAACTGIDLVTRSVTAATSSGQTTTVTFTNRGKPVLRICKVAGAGVTAGTVYDFWAGGINVNEGAEANVAAGDCGDLVLPEATYSVLEDVPDGEAVQSIVCAPADACPDINASVGEVKVAVVRGLTTVTFTNRSIIGTLRICKVAGAGVVAGTVYDFSAGGIDVNDAKSYDVAAGACEDGQLEEGNYTVTESVPAGTAVSAIVCNPVAACSDPSLSVGVVTAAVTGATLTTVTYTNRSTIGTLRVCKVAGTGVTPGSMFHFTAGGIDVTDAESYDVAAGACQDGQLKEGNYTLAESVPAGTAVSAIVCNPVAACSNPSLSVGVVTAAVTGAALTTVTFTNRSIIATLRICKIAGTGQSGVFQFSAGGINVNDAASFDVAAGGCQDRQLQEGSYLVAESVPAGSTVSDISCVPAIACSNISVAAGALHAALTGATTTTITFTNVPSGDDLAFQQWVGSGSVQLQRMERMGYDAMTPGHYPSALSASVGSMLSARRSGTAHATRPTTSMTALAARRIITSRLDSRPPNAASELPMMIPRLI